MVQKIELVPHQKNWHITFRKEKNLIVKTLGEIACRVHHIGSTAVPDLLAKSIIDITLESSEYPPTIEMAEKLASIGYQDRGEAGVSGRNWFIKGVPRQFNLHVCAINSVVIQKQVLFRDQLKANKSLRRAYEKVKLENSVGQDIDSAEYATAKTDLVTSAISDALFEKSRNQ